MSKKSFFCLIGLALWVALLAACGGEGAQPQAPRAEAETEPQTPRPGEWSGQGISFTVAGDGGSITYMEVRTAYGVQWLHESVPIENNKFEFYRSGNSYLGIPSFKIEGTFNSRDSVSGMVDEQIEWSASPDGA